MRILLAIWPDVHRDILVYALLHDIGEIATGDLPFPTKQQNHKLKEIMDDAEFSAHLSMCLPWNLPPPRKLHDKEIPIFKLADYLEMWEWALDELAFGNSTADPVRERCMREIEILITLVDEGVRHNVQMYIKRRLT